MFCSPARFVVVRPLLGSHCAIEALDVVTRRWRMRWSNCVANISFHSNVFGVYTLRNDIIIISHLRFINYNNHGDVSSLGWVVNCRLVIDLGVYTYSVADCVCVWTNYTTAIGSQRHEMCLSVSQTYSNLFGFTCHANWIVSIIKIIISIEIADRMAIIQWHPVRIYRISMLTSFGPVSRVQCVRNLVIFFSFALSFSPSLSICFVNRLIDFVSHRRQCAKRVKLRERVW